MTANELRELADKLLDPPTEFDDDKRIAAYLRACADAMEAGPVAWRYKPMLGSPWSLSDDGYYISCKRDQGYIAERLYQLAMTAPAIPQGWKLVPVEPTPVMTAAYSVAAEELTKRHLLSGSYPATWQPIEAGYAAMLAAAPTPPVAAENTSPECVSETAGREHEPLHLSRILHELAGAASLCWEPRPSGVFDSQQAIAFVEDAIAEIRSRMPTLRLPEPMSDAEAKKLGNDLSYLPTMTDVVVYVEAEVLRRVKEANK